MILQVGLGLCHRKRSHLFGTIWIVGAVVGRTTLPSRSRSCRNLSLTLCSSIVVVVVAIVRTTLDRPFWPLLHLFPVSLFTSPRQ